MTDIEDILNCPTNNVDVGKVEACKGCPGLELCLSEDKKLSDDDDRLKLRLSAITHKIMILSGKGGVGKSTITSTMAQVLSFQGYSVGVLDIDICGPSIPKLLGIVDLPVMDSQWGWKPLLSPFGKIKIMSVGSMLSSDKQAVIWKGPRKTGLIKRLLKDTLWGRLDFLLIDTPPGTSDEHLTTIKLLAASDLGGAVIVTTPQNLSSTVVSREIKFCEKLKVPILGILENMSGFTCPCCNEMTAIFEGNAGQYLSNRYNVPFLGHVPLNLKVIQQQEKDKPINEESSKYIESVNAAINIIVNSL